MDRAFKGPRRHHSFYAKHRRTDHLSFDEVGIPGFQFIQDTLDYDSRTHHSNTDTYERLQAEDLAQAATVEAVFVYNTAMRDQMLPGRGCPSMNSMPGYWKRRQKK